MDVQQTIKLAELLARSKVGVPRQLYGDVAGVTAVLLAGSELGLGPMESLRSIHVIEGKLTLSAEVILALAAKRGVRWRWIETTQDTATIEVSRNGEVLGSISWTSKDAERAGLSGKGGWRLYPAAMLRARAASAAIRAYCPDVLATGVYATEELADYSPSEEPTKSESAEPQRECAEPQREPQPPKRIPLRDTSTPGEVLEWCRASAVRFAAWTDEKRQAAISSLADKCAEVGADFDEALLILQGGAK